MLDLMRIIFYTFSFSRGKRVRRTRFLPNTPKRGDIWKIICLIRQNGYLDGKMSAQYIKLDA